MSARQTRKTVSKKPHRLKRHIDRVKGISLKHQLQKVWYLLGKLFQIKIVRYFLVLLLFIILLPFLLYFLLKPEIQRNINYGVTFSPRYATEMGLDWKKTHTAILDDLGIKHLRVVAYWDQIESQKDVYDFSEVKWQLDEAQKRDAKVIMTIGRKVPRWPECFEPDWWKRTEDENIKKAELYQYVEMAIKELKSYDNITMWQVENEPFFKFGECDYIDKEDVQAEIAIVRRIDDKKRPILVQDSGEGGYWFPTYSLGDYLGISMYRRIWFDFWGIFLGRSVYFKYPLGHWTYAMKGKLLRVPTDKIIVTELQAEPWGPRINSQLTDEERDQTMSRDKFLDTIAYAQQSGIKDLYLWGVEWWYWEKEVNHNPFYWNAVKAIAN